jgi:methanethiol S-methyltransferase
MTGMVEMSAIDRAFVWLGGALFVSSLAFCAWWYLVPLGGRRGVAGPSALLADVLIFSVFALHHSVFARDGVKRALARAVPDRLSRSVYVWTASVLFIMVFVLWRPIGGTVYEVEGAPALANAAIQLLGVWTIAQSVRGLDPLELAGIRPQAPIGGLQTTGPYHLVRHPLYFGWALAVFGAAHMTGDRLAFAAISTLYLVAAIPFEESSLVKTFGDDYRRYQTRVRWRMLPYVY